MTIGSFVIGPDRPPFIIAELSGNHNGSLEHALAIVDAAADAGAHALKLQTYTADTMTLDARGGLFDITNPSSPWYGRNLYELYEEAHTPWAWHAPLFARARERGMAAFSSPFDESAVDFLLDLDVPAFKIASFESNHHPLLRKIAATGKPVLISSGTSRIDELYEAIRVLRDGGAGKIVIFKCTSSYPASPETTNLATIPVLQEIFPTCTIGLSDHTLGIGASVAAVALGARVIEKHFTLRRADGGVDSAFSLEPAELRALVEETERAYLALGRVQLEPQRVEQANRQFKRSIYATRDVRAGELITRDNIGVIRPGDGLHPRYYERLLGGRALVDLPFATPLSLETVALSEASTPVSTS